MKLLVESVSEPIEKKNVAKDKTSRSQQNVQRQREPQSDGRNEEERRMMGAKYTGNHSYKLFAIKRDSEHSSPYTTNVGVKTDRMRDGPRTNSARLSTTVCKRFPESS